MKAAVFAYSRLGCKTAERAAGYFSRYQLRMFAPQRVKPGNFSLLPPHDPDFYGQQFAWADVLLFVGSCGIAVRQIAPHVRDKRTDPAVLVMDETAAFVVPFSLLPPHDPDFYGQQFAWADVLLFVGSCGIAVRQIAPHVRDKRTDPAVLVMDETAAFVVPLLSGHIGGANRLAAGLAAFMGAVPVVTTATDIQGRFSVDAGAAQKGYRIGDMAAAYGGSPGGHHRHGYPGPFFCGCRGGAKGLPHRGYGGGQKGVGGNSGRECVLLQ